MYICSRLVSNKKNMKKYTTKIGVYDSNTMILIGTYTLSCSVRCQQINDRRAMLSAKEIYRKKRIEDLTNQYGEVIYRLVDDGLINPLSIYAFEIL